MTRSAPTIEKLTPREWDVLALVRRGLTNEQIAAELGISRDGAKYHVSEILGKLGVQDRIEAARWYDRETRQRAGVFGVFGRLMGRRAHGAPPGSASGLTRAPAIAVIAVAALAFAGLLAGVLVMDSRGGQSEALSEDRRSGDARLDELVISLVAADETAVRNSATGISARQYDSTSGRETVYPPDEWLAMLGGAPSRELYAVMTGDPQQAPSRDFDVYLQIVTADGEVEGWQFAVDDYRVVDVSVGDDPAWVADGLSFQFERFVVLPPAQDRPQPPAAHALTVETGDTGIDGVLETLARHDAAGLLALAEYDTSPCGEAGTPLCGSQPVGTPVEAAGMTECGRQTSHASRAFIEQRLTAIAQTATGIVGVATLPDGYFPAGDALVIVLVAEAPYRWEMNVLVVADGRVAGLVNRCSPQAELLYPPSAFVVLPPADGAPGVEPGRRSGIAAVDSFLDALEAGDVAAMTDFLSYETIGCVVQPRGIGAPPQCLPGEADGTPVQAMPVAQCEGFYARAPDFEAETSQRLADGNFGVYAGLDLGAANPTQTSFGRGRYEVVLHDPSQPEFQRSLALAFDDIGVTLVWYGCGPQDPSEMYWTGRAPDWLLAPP